MKANANANVNADLIFLNSSPLDQFKVRDLISLDAPVLANLHISVTNIGLYLTIAALLVIVLNLLSTNYNKFIANSWLISQESVYALFVFILLNNLIGMIPYSFVSTSHFILTFSLSFTVVLATTIYGFLMSDN